MKTKNDITAIVIAKNAEDKIKNCLDSLSWADELVVIDTGSTDKTKKIAERYKCKIYLTDKGDFSDWRNLGKEKAECKYLLYLDTDEVINEDLKNEILSTVNDWPEDVACFAFPRKNVIFGKILMHGGWYPDYVIRLFKKEDLKAWHNELHEQPEYKGNLQYLKSAIVHYKENSLSQMLVKTNKRSEVEAKLMFDAGHPPMTVARFASAMCREFFYRFIKHFAFLDGGKGIIMGIYQVYSRFISYAKLWEMQIKSDENYKRLKI